MEPTDTSTPKKFRVSGRAGITDYKADTVLSPVPNTTDALNYPQTELDENLRERKNEANEVYRDELDEDDSDSDESDSTTRQQDVHVSNDVSAKAQEIKTIPPNDSHPQNNTNKNLFIVLIALIGIGASCTLLPNTVPNSNGYDSRKMMSEIQSNFPLQNGDLWIYINSSIYDAKTFDKPAVMIFLYRRDTEATVKKLLAETAKYASCVLNDDCSIAPISLTGNDLNEPELIEDYGVTISKYTPPLQTQRVMIVENFDEVSVYVAQAFHSFCDEFSPVVSPSLFLFTIEVDEFVGKELTQAENVLREKWGELEGDKLEPLLTRISNIVLKVTPEVEM